MMAQTTQVVDMFKPLKSKKTLNLKNLRRALLATTIKLQARVKGKPKTTETLCCRKVMFTTEIQGKIGKFTLQTS